VNNTKLNFKNIALATIDILVIFFFGDILLNLNAQNINWIFIGISIVAIISALINLISIFRSSTDKTDPNNTISKSGRTVIIVGLIPIIVLCLLVFLIMFWLKLVGFK